MRCLFAACLVLTAFVAPAAAGGAACRLSTADCTIIAREMANEEIARIQDERTFAPYMLSGPRAHALLKRHFSRKAERYRYIPTRIANEWARMEFCSSQESVADSMTTDEINDALNGKKPNPVDPSCR